MSDDDKKTWNTRIAVGKMAYDAGYYSQAARHFRTALEFAQEHNMDQPYLSINYISLGKTLASMGNYKEAEKFLMKALIIDEALEDHNMEVASDYSELGMLYFKLGRLEESTQYNQKALDILNTLKEPPAMLQAKILKLMAIIKSEAGELETAVSLIDKAIEKIEKVHGGKDQLLYGEALMVKTMILVDLGKEDEAREIYPQALQLVEMNRGPFHPKVATMMDMFATMTSNAGRQKVSEYLKNKAQHIRDFGRRHIM